MAARHCAQVLRIDGVHDVSRSEFLGKQRGAIEIHRDDSLLAFATAPAPPPALWRSAEKYFDDGDAVQGLRLDVLDLVDGGRKAWLVDCGDTQADFLSRQPGWFQSMLMTEMLISGKMPPQRNLTIHIA